MRPPLSSGVWTALTAAWAAVIAYGAVMPVQDIGFVGPLDKVIHLCEYLLLAWGVMQATRTRGWSPGRRVAIGLLLPMAYGLFLEGVQGLLAYRQGDLADALANGLGAGLGVWPGYWWAERAKR